MNLDPLKAFLVLFVAVLVQVSVLSAYTPFGGTSSFSVWRLAVGNPSSRPRRRPSTMVPST